MNWAEYLEAGEEVLWEGRPAPRCYTFRNWMHSLFGIVILIAAAGWMIFGLYLGNEHQQYIFSVIPVPFLLFGFYLSFGHLLLARLEWEHVFYALTDRRLVAVKGVLRHRLESLPVSDVIWFHLGRLGEHLGTVRVRTRDPDRKMAICCIEYPHKLTALLEEVLDKNGIEPRVRPDT